jgi:hypothetical protein
MTKNNDKKKTCTTPHFDAFPLTWRTTERRKDGSTYLSKHPSLWEGLGRHKKIKVPIYFAVPSVFRIFATHNVEKNDYQHKTKNYDDEKTIDNDGKFGCRGQPLRPDITLSGCQP